MKALLLALSLVPRALAGDSLGPAAAQIEKLEALASLSAERAGWVGRKDSAAYCAGNPATIVRLPLMDREVLFACYAFRDADPSRCRTMPAAFLARSLENCSAMVELMTLFIVVTAPSPSTIRSCGKTFGLANPRLNPEDRPRACEALARPGTSAQRCAAFQAAVPTAFRGENFQACVDTVEQVSSGLGCDILDSQSYEVVGCRAYAKFRMAREGKPKDCKSDYLCRALQGDAAACDAGRDALVAAACAPAPGDRGRSTASPVLMREIAETLAWAAHRPVLDPAGREALARLDEAMLGRRELETKSALADLAALRTSAAEEFLENAGASTDAAALRARLTAARSRIPR